MISSHYYNELKSYLKLLIPLVLAQALQIILGTVDVIFAGKVGLSDLAGVSIGANLFLIIQVTMMGLVMGSSPFLSRDFGASNESSLRKYFINTLILAIFVGIFCFFLVYFGAHSFLKILKTETDLINSSERYLKYVSFSFPAIMIYRSYYSLLTSINKTKTLLKSGIVGFLVNIPLCYLLTQGIYGYMGLGGAGTGLATSISLWIGVIYLIKTAPVKNIFSFSKMYNLWASFFELKAQRELFKEGAPIAVAFFAEISLFSCITFFVAKLGAVAIASNQVALSYFGIVYIVPSSLGSLAVSKIGNAIGRKNKNDFKLALKIAFSVGYIYAFFILLGTLIFKTSILKIYTKEVEVLNLASEIFFWGAMYQIFDMTQVLSACALRAFRKSDFASIVQTCSYWGIGIGFGYILAFKFNIAWLSGVTAFWGSINLALFVASVILVLKLLKEIRNYESSI